MKCLNCGTRMETRRENYRYIASGLPNVVLLDVDVHRCAECGGDAVSLPRIEQLHRGLAMAIIRERGRLTPQEIRFLRKWRGWSSADFARFMGVDPSTVSRWESVDAPQAMGPQAERALRLAVAHGEPADTYPIETLGELDASLARSPMLRMKVGRTGWEASVSA